MRLGLSWLEVYSLSPDVERDVVHPILQLLAGRPELDSHHPGAERAARRRRLAARRLLRVR